MSHHHHPGDGGAVRATSRSRQRSGAGRSAGVGRGGGGRLRPVAQGSPQGRRSSGEPWDYRKPMMAFAPVIGAKPSSGALFGAAGNVAFYRGDPATTRISSIVASLTFSTKKQTALTDRFTMFGARRPLAPRGRPSVPVDVARDLRARHERRHQRGRGGRLRLLPAPPHRVLPAASRRSSPAPACTSTTTPTSGPREGDEAAWPTSPYVQYSEAHGLPLDTQRPRGTSVDLLWDSRDSFINADHGWLAKASYRALFDGFLGGDSSWQKVNLDVRTYRRSRATAATGSPSGRSPIWSWAAWRRIFDLPSTAATPTAVRPAATAKASSAANGSPTVRSSIGRTLMRNGLLGMVAFLNTTTVTNLGRRRAICSTASPPAAAPDCGCSSTSDRRPTCASTSASASRGRRASIWRSNSAWTTMWPPNSK